MLRNKKCIINIKNNDDNCFLYAVAAALISNGKINKNRPNKYIEFIEANFKYDLTKMPMKLKEIPKFEYDNKLKINIFELIENPYIPKNKDEMTKHPYINLKQKSKITENYKVVNLLFLQNNNKSHYVTVSDVDKLLNNRHNENIVRIQSKWCHNCLIGYKNNKSLAKHEKLCKLKKAQNTLFTLPKNLLLKFNAFHKTVSPPFVIYADFESCINTVDSYKEIHTPLSAGMLLLGPNGFKLYHTFIGENCIIDFLKKLDELSKFIVYSFYKNNQKSMIFTDSDKLEFEKANQRYLCF